MFIFFQGLPEQMFFSYKQEEKLACGFCPCCRINLRSETSALFLLLAFSPNLGWEEWIRGAYPAAPKAVSLLGWMQSAMGWSTLPGTPTALHEKISSNRVCLRSRPQGAWGSVRMAWWLDGVVSCKTTFCQAICSTLQTLSPNWRYLQGPKHATWKLLSRTSVTGTWSSGLSRSFRLWRHFVEIPQKSLLKLRKIHYEIWEKNVSTLL